MIVCRGVRMFLGVTEEEGGEAVLRPVERLCGLTMGGHDPFDDWDFGFDVEPETRDQFPRLALVGGTAARQQCVDATDQSVDVASMVERVSGQRHRRLP